MSSDWGEENDDQSKVEDQDKDSKKKSPKTNPRFFVAIAFTPRPPKLAITDHFGKRSSATHKKEEYRCDTIATLLEHEDQDMLEEID